MLADGMVHLREHDSSGAPLASSHRCWTRRVEGMRWRWTGEYLILVTS